MDSQKLQQNLEKAAMGKELEAGVQVKVVYMIRQFSPETFTKVIRKSQGFEVFQGQNQQGHGGKECENSVSH